MTDGKTDTQELMTVIEPTPDTPQEGASMPIEIPPGDDGLRSHVIRLTMRVTLTEAKVESMDARIASFMTPQQIADMIKAAIDDSVKRVETLVNTIAVTVGDNVFDSARIDSIDAKLATRAENAAESDRKLDRVIQFINTLAADDVTDPDSKPSGMSWFTRVEQMAKAADDRAHNAALEISQARLDHVEAIRKADEQAAALAKQNAQIAPLVVLAVKAQALVDLTSRVMRNRVTMALLVAAFGGGMALTPELLKALGNFVVSVFSVFAGG